MAFPTWPPPSGGAPVTAWELGPIQNPYPYGSGQTANISISGPAPVKNATKYPMKMPVGATGQNQNQSLPAWPHTRVCTLPDKASPTISAISPAPIMGPGSGGVHLLASQVSRVGTVGRTFPAGSAIDGLGTVVTPTRVIGGLGN